ncbi:MAG TPA: hypothetical protein VKR06_18010 [Ktedonosporobacter sp.]|nr:hypothetical protein [Ktedonosporobacter sp.]
MLIMNDQQSKIAGIESLKQRCVYCSKVLHAYPLIVGDDPQQSVYHIACAVELATDILLDLTDFFCPPTPFDRVVMITTPPSESYP